MPNLRRAHGAWVFLVVSVGAGALWAREAQLMPALLAGTGHVGAFLMVAGLLDRSGRAGEWLRGAAIAVGATSLALLMGADPTYLIFGALSVLPAAGAVLATQRYGPLSLAAVALSSIAITLAAPATACAGGVAPARAALLVLLLAPFFTWRAYRVVVRVIRSPGGRRESLRTCGLREAGVAATWSLAVAIFV